ncbi:MAG: tetratricopeptide repeat protein [Xanthomonadaceae bacterium]|jgi:regulator of sirC expression with transglutaminase-like and TPR domain|nr:tetratricopeptide repeat protein [Xanthomonadaceae bacterium]
METHLLLPDWDTLATLDDSQLPLLQTALLIARDEYPDLDVDFYRSLVHGYAEYLRPKIETIPVPPLKMAAINRHLFDELGYGGNHDEYYDPRNSYLNQVIDRRLGNPISLALVQIEVARQLGLPLDGVSFPGHFLVRMSIGDGMLIMDPFNGGRPLAVEELRERASAHLDGETPDDQMLLEILSPAPNRAILVRVLRNLLGVYAERNEWDRVARSADRILKLSPTLHEAQRDRGLAYLQMGYLRGAQADLTHYLQALPDANDADELHGRLVDLLSQPVSLH